MYGETLWGIRELLMLVPLVGDTAAERCHLPYDVDLLGKCSLGSSGKHGGLVPQPFQEALVLLGHELNAVRVQQLIVTKRGRNRPCARGVVLKPGLGVIFAVAPDLEHIDPDRL